MKIRIEVINANGPIKNIGYAEIDIGQFKLEDIRVNIQKEEWSYVGYWIGH